MARPLRVGPRQLADLLVVGQIGIERLKAVLNFLERLDAPVIAASELRSLISDYLESEEEAVPLVRQLVALASFCRSWGEEPKDAIEGLMAGVEDAKLDEESKRNLKEMVPILTALLNQESVYLTSKALHLSYDYENLYRDGNIITDIRPVFDERRGCIVGAVVSQTLRLRFDAGNEVGDLSIALDNDDIEKLRDTCELVD